MRKILLAFVLIGPVITGQRASSAADAFDSVRRVIQREMSERQVPSVAVAVARDGRIVWEEAFGWADRENRIAATPHTLYSLASISKPITATALMILKERGLIDLDRPINDYLGEAKINVRVGDAAAATVRRVANHTAGLPLHYQFFYEDEPYRAPSRDETILRYGNTVTPPGERYHYSNLGYGILDHVISRVSGKTYRDFMRTEVFVPLGLTHMSVDVEPAMQKQQAVRYGTDGLPIPFYAFDHPGGSAVYASAHDLVRFAMFHLKADLPDQKPILSDSAIDDMQRPTADAGNGQGYGIGWMSTEYQGGRRSISHTGGMGGVSTSLRLFPAEKIAIVVLTNAGSHPVAGTVMNEIEKTLLPDLARRPPVPAAPAATFDPPNELVGTWTGEVHTHRAAVPLTIEIKKDGDIHARLGIQLQTLLNRVVWRDGYLTGQMMGDIGTDDASRTPHTLSVTLRLRGSLLVGGMTAMSLPARRVGNALTHWVQLKKE
ncbi:MAG TPA: serine hydrolase domain-containing protein [Vicinamibacterales bacterium]|nr:serine hydrolase domain-containing protein [Vicinamibacterales bacterium]